MNYCRIFATTIYNKNYINFFSHVDSILLKESKIAAKCGNYSN